MSSGDLLIQINTKRQSDALLALNSISDYRVTVTAHRTLNTVQGIISEDDLLDTPEKEVVEGLATQGVTAARRITLRRDGVELKTKHIVLTFESTSLPEVVRAGYLQCRVRPYVPNLLRCFKCQRFGHGSRSCRGTNKCAKCSSKEHVADECESEPLCSNCEGHHPAYSRSCPVWNQEKEIIALKIKENISYIDAKKRFAFISKGSYAQAVHRGPARSVVSTGTQTSSDDLRLPLGPPSSGAVPVALPPNRKVDAPSSASTSGAVPMAPPPNRKVDAAASASTSGQGMTSPTPPAASVPRGRGLHSRNSGPQRKPGEPPKQSTSAGQPEAIASPTEEPMNESGPRSDEDALLSGSESSSCAPSGPTGKQKETTKKKSALRIKIDFKT
ncbi:uncharacterized protein ISCGN_010498 [Ixodes scapularis]